MGSSRGVWGLRPKLGVPPLHPVLSLVTMVVSVSITVKIYRCNSELYGVACVLTMVE